MKLVLPIFVAAFVAFVLGWFAASSFRARGREASESVVKVDPAAKTEGAAQLEDPARGSTTPDRTDAVAPTRTEERSASEGLISNALRSYAHAEIDAGWHETRQDALPEVLLNLGFGEFEALVKSQPREIGRRLAQRQTGLETIASDDPFAVIEALIAGDYGPQPDLVRDDKRMARFFACESGPRVEGAKLAVSASTEAVQLQSGTLIDFPPGVHDIDALSNQLRTFPRCLTIAGSGMDRTLLRFRNLHPYAKLERLEIRDCTLQTSCEAIDLRVAGVWRAQRVRFVGFDCGAGGSSAVSVMHGAILELKSCRIEGGFGRSPVHGNLFDVRSDGFIARFEDCTISLLDTRLSNFPRGATLLLRRCRFEDLLDRRPIVDSEDDGILIEATTFELRDKKAPAPVQRDLAELFPAWIQPTNR